VTAAEGFRWPPGAVPLRERRRLRSRRLGVDRDGTGREVRGRAGADPDAGRALIEVVFLAVLILIPTVYVLATVVRIQAATFAVAQGARDAARVLDAAPSVDVGVARAEEIARIALTDQQVPADGMTVRFVQAGSDCVTAPAVAPSLSRGDVYDICVVAVVQFPGVPTVVTGTQNTVTGVFTLHVGDFREGD